jgi:hypothetical protein
MMSRMKSVLTAIAIVVPCLLAGSARADVAIEANNKTVHVDCAKDANIALLGNHLTVTATGVCTAVTVAGNECSFAGSAVSVSVPGNHNTVTLAAADDVSVPGNDNTVSVKKAIKHKAPNVSNTGTHNSISP